jgi:hypothetical protein
MSDLVERLRHCSQHTSDEYLHELTGRAANRIEELERQLAALTKHADAMADALEINIADHGCPQSLSVLADYTVFQINGDAV